MKIAKALLPLLLCTGWVFSEPLPQLSDTVQRPVTQITPAPRVRGEIEIPNIWVVKQQLKEYFEGGQYEQEVAEIVHTARDYLAENLSTVHHARPALVLDIDETSLSNYRHIASLDFGYIPRLWTEWVAAAEAPPIQPTLELYRWARAQGIAVIFITGRTEMERAATEKNLRAAGYDSWAELCLKPNPKMLNSDFKVSERKRLIGEGYRILANVGDQMSDLERGYAEAVFKLPNPLYFVR